jgi:hypothetical protein
MQVTGVTSLSTSPLSLGHANLHISAERRAHGGYINIAASMDVLHPDRYERVRDSLLHLGLRQITEEPGPDQPANFARRRARFKEHRQKLDDYRATQRAARVAAEERTDSELRARLDGVDSMCVLLLARNNLIAHLCRIEDQLFR